MKIAIAGLPKAGKTTLAKEINFKHTYHTDDLIETHKWSEVSQEVSEWFNKKEFVIEGVAVARALRKWLKKNNNGVPCDILILLEKPYVELSKGQQTMAKGCITVMNEIKQELIDRGVRIQTKWEKKDQKELLEIKQDKKKQSVTKKKSTKSTKRDILTKRMKDFLIIFKSNAGLIQASCEKAKIDRTTYYLWLKRSEKFKQACEDVDEKLKDFVEGKILNHMKSDDNKISADMCKFYAKTKMKGRGYIEKQEVEHSGNSSVNINLIEKSVEEIKDGKSDNKSETERNAESSR